MLAFGCVVDRLCHVYSPLPLYVSSRQLAHLRTSILPNRTAKPCSRKSASALCARSSDEPAAAAAPHSGSIAAAEFPTAFERLASALMFLLPFAEGVFRQDLELPQFLERSVCRLALSFVQSCKEQALEFMYWCHHQHKQVSLALAARTVSDISRDDVVTLQTLMQMSEKLHLWFSNCSVQLASLSRPLQQFRDTALGSGWLSATIGTPEALWQLGCLLYMSVMTGLAALKLRRRTNEHQPSNGLAFFFRKPQIVTVSYLCALLLRMSWVPMEGMSDLSLDIYWLGAAALTVLTTGCAALQMHTLLFARMPKFAQFLENMAQEVTVVAQLHRSFLLLDWALCLFSSLSFKAKTLRCVLLLVYWRTLTALEGAVQSAKQASLK